VVARMRRRARQANDPRVVRVLAALHADLGAVWTVTRLARLAGASRAAFVRLFAGETGLAPMAYLREQRLAKAAERLVLPSPDGAVHGAKLDALAAELGYSTSFALSRAFKRRFGLAPIVYREVILRASFARGWQTPTTARAA
jgi:AraC-like DNA-binding protein